MIARILSMAVASYLMIEASVSGQALIFADDLESGDFSAWSSVTTGTATPAGVVRLPVNGAFAGDLGLSRVGSLDGVTCVEIRDDRPFERGQEVAFAGIPMPEGLGSTSTDGLVLIGPGGRRLASQVDVLSRWGGPLDDTSRPIRWLEASVQPRVAADDSLVYALQRYDSLAPALDPFAATVTPAGELFVVDTGLATFTPRSVERSALPVDHHGSGWRWQRSHDGTTTRGCNWPTSSAPTSPSLKVRLGGAHRGRSLQHPAGGTRELATPSSMASIWSVARSNTSSASPIVPNLRLVPSASLATPR